MGSLRGGNVRAQAEVRGQILCNSWETSRVHICTGLVIQFTLCSLICNFALCQAHTLFSQLSILHKIMLVNYKFRSQLSLVDPEQLFPGRG